MGLVCHLVTLHLQSFRLSLLFRRAWFVCDVKDCVPLSRNKVAMIGGFPSLWHSLFFFMASQAGIHEYKIPVKKQSFLTDRYSTVFLILGQHSRHQLRCNPMHVQLICENSLTRSITNSSLCTEIVYGKTTILVDCRPYLCQLWGGCCRAWPTWSLIISSRSSVILETSKPLKS